MGRVLGLASIAIALLLAALCGIARLEYRRFLYPAPQDDGRGPLPAEAERLDLRASDGVAVHAIQLRPPAHDARTIVVFHGNGDIAEYLVGLALDLRRRGFGVVLAEYRGYGASAKAALPSEPGLYRDALAVLDALAAQGIGADRLVLMGHSLGTGVAAEMAARGRGASLVLVSPFTSIATLVDRAVPIVPGAWVCPDRFDTVSKVQAIHVPTLIVHGDEDEVVPFAMGRALASILPDAKLFTVKGGHHNDLFTAWGEQVLARIAEHAGM